MLVIINVLAIIITTVFKWKEEPLALLYKQPHKRLSQTWSRLFSKKYFSWNK